jgi:hypothetical protein
VYKPAGQNFLLQVEAISNLTGQFAGHFLQRQQISLQLMLGVGAGKFMQKDRPTDRPVSRIESTAPWYLADAIFSSLPHHLAMTQQEDNQETIERTRGASTCELPLALVGWVLDEQRLARLLRLGHRFRRSGPPRAPDPSSGSGWRRARS